MPQTEMIPYRAFLQTTGRRINKVIDAVRAVEPVVDLLQNLNADHAVLAQFSAHSSHTGAKELAEAIVELARRKGISASVQVRLEDRGFPKRHHIRPTDAMEPLEFTFGNRNAAVRMLLLGTRPYGPRGNVEYLLRIEER